MLVVVGSPAARNDPNGIGAAGIASRVAKAAVEAGAAAQLVGRVGEDPTGEAVLLDLAAQGIGHVAVLRTPGAATPVVEAGAPAEASDLPLTEALEEADHEDANRPGEADGLPLDPEDLELAMRYLPDYRVVVVAAALDPATLDAVVAAAAWAEAQLIVVADPETPTPSLPAEMTVLERPADDPDGVFAAMVGRFAAALDRGEDARSAFEAARAGVGWSAVSG
jgi:hypothetical protein